MPGDLEREYVEYVTAALPSLRRLATQLVGDPHRADDLVQQAITRLYVKWRRVREAADIHAYAQKTLVRVFLDERRQRWATVTLVPQLADRPEPVGDGAEDRAVVLGALAKVPPRQRAVLVLRFLADCSVEEVAGQLGCSPGTVKSQTAAGLATLRRLLPRSSFASTGKE